MTELLPVADVKIEPNENEEISSEFVETGNLYQTIYQNEQLQACCLCPTGQILQYKLLEHLHLHHSNDSPTFAMMECSCKDCLQLQSEIVCHLISHISDHRISIKVEPEINVDYNFMSSPSSSLSSHEPVQQKLKENPIKIFKERKFKARDFKKDVISGKFNCPYCKVIYTNVYKLRDHCNERHSSSSNDSRFHCKMCPKRYDSQSAIEKHILQMHNESKPVKCSKCLSRFDNLKSKDRHEKLHFISDGFNSKCKNDVTCLICFKTFSLRCRALIHIEKHLQKNSSQTPVNKVKKFHCDKCTKKYPEKKYLMQHLQRHIKKELGLRLRRDKYDLTGKIICDQCSEWVHPARMRQHNLHYHTDKTPTFFCSETGCKASFRYQSSMDKHKKIHIGKHDWHCEYCGKGFFSESNMKQHLLRHIDPERFKCSVCNQCLVDSRALRKHMRIHDDPDAPRPFACDQCDKTYRYEDELSKHQRGSHKVPEQVEMHCTMCSYVAHTKIQYTRHVYKVHKVRQRRYRVFPAISEAD